MSKRLTHEYVKNHINSFGYELISLYKNSREKIAIRCEQGHIYQTKWDVFKKGYRCPTCSGKKKITIEEVKEVFEKEGYKLISKEIERNNSKMKFICPNNHHGEIAYSSFKSGKRCFKCFGTPKKTIQEVRSLFEQDGYKLEDLVYTNCKSKLKTICPKGHTYFTCFSDFRAGYRCAFCAGKVITIEQIKLRMEQDGYELLSSEYVNSVSPLKVKCPTGHEYTTKWNLFQPGHRCPICNKSGTDYDAPGFLYYGKLSIQGNIFYKIGITNKDPMKRLNDVCYGAKLLWVESFLFCRYAYEKEQFLLKKYASFLANDKTLPLRSGYTEVFTEDVLKKDILSEHLLIRH